VTIQPNREQFEKYKQKQLEHRLQQTLAGAAAEGIQYGNFY
uniref:Peptidylprolyl isomerase n=1 Tax=Globodera pallida TaxID=36090 RepID=A0A183CSM4_GLOPA